MGTNTATYNGRFQRGNHTYVEALRRVGTILQVRSHVLLSASSFLDTLSVIFILLHTQNATFKLRKEVGIFIFLLSSRVQFRVVLLCIFRIRDYPHRCKLAQFPSSVSPLSGARLVRGIFILHLMATVVWGEIPSSWPKCWTTRDCHRQHYH